MAWQCRSELVEAQRERHHQELWSQAPRNYRPRRSVPGSTLSTWMQDPLRIVTTRAGRRKWPPRIASPCGSNPPGHRTRQAADGWSPYPGAPMGWERMTFDLVGAHDVREAIQWADATLASNEGPASRRGCPVHDQEYVIYAKVPNEDLWLQVAGRHPVL